MSHGSQTGNTAVVHEWVAARAGSEHVFEALAATLPEADLYALSVEPGTALDLGGRTVETSFLDTNALRGRRALTLPVMPLAWRTIGRRRYDMVVTSHHAFAASNRLVRPDGLHLVYVHTPARYIWSPEVDQRGATPLLGPVRALLRHIDWRAMQRPTSLAANSREVAGRIHRYWGREAQVIHPPVDVRFFGRAREAVMDLPDDYLLTVGRFIPYKNHEFTLRL